MGRVIGFEKLIEITEMEEADAITLLLKASNLDSLPEHEQTAKQIVISLECTPLAVDQAGAYIEAGKCGIVKCKKTELCEIPMIGRTGIRISDD